MKKTCHLGDITSWSSGGTPNKQVTRFWEGNIPWISAKSMKQEFISDSELHISLEGLKAGSCLANEGDILLLVRGSELFNRIPICYANNQVAFNQDVKAIAASKEILPLYLFYWLKAKEDYLKAKVESTGIGAGKFDLEFLQNLSIDLPSLDKQQQIVNILHSITRKIENNAAINRNLEEQAKAIFKSWFVDFEPFQDGEFIDSELGKIPKGWATGTFSSLIDSTISGDWGKETLTGNFTEQVYCIRGTDIPEVKKGNKGKMPFRFILPKNFLSKKLLVGDLVVEISGGSPTQSTGRSAVITQSLLNRYDKGMVCTNFCKALKPKPGYSMFVSHYWDYLYAMNKFFSYENGTTGIKNLDVNGFIDTEPIIIPPSSVVSAFSKLCNKCSEQIYANGQENECLQRTRDTLLIKLMSGEIDVSKVERMEALA